MQPHGRDNLDVQSKNKNNNSHAIFNASQAATLQLSEYDGC